MTRDPYTFGQLTREDLDQRFKEQTSEFYSQMVFLVKGGVLTIAVVTLIEVFPGAPGRLPLESAIFFVASCFEVLVPVATYRRGLLLASSRIHLVDYIAPFGMGAAEIMMFWVLSPTRITTVDYRALWFLAVSAHAFFAVILLTTRLGMLRRSDFASDLQGLVRAHRKWLIRDLIGALVLAMATLVVFLKGETWGMGDWISAPALFGIDQWKAGAAQFEFSGFGVAASVTAVIAMALSIQAVNQHQLTIGWFQQKSPKEAN